MSNRNNLFQTDRKNLFQRFVTMDEAWVHHFHPESSNHNSEKNMGPPPQKKTKSALSAGKVMGLCFLGCWLNLIVDYIQNGHTIDGAYYASLPMQLIKTKTTWKVEPECAVSWRQCFHTDISHCPGHHQWMWNWTLSNTSRYEVIRLLSIRKLIKALTGTRFLFGWWRHISHERLIRLPKSMTYIKVGENPFNFGGRSVLM